MADLTDHVDHGTHVAGIIAAAWNGEGTSGVANGVRLIGVRVADDSGAHTSEASIRAFNYLVKCAREINLKSINCSWGSSSAEFSFTLLVNQLGEQGAVTVFASGNENQDVGLEIVTSSFIESPNLISVNAHNSAGNRAGFSCFSATSTDVFAPGTQILSTVPSHVQNPGADASVYRTFTPTSAQDAGVLGFEDFSQAGSTAAAYASNPAQANGEARQIGKVVSETGVDDASSYKIMLDEIGETEDTPDEQDGPEEQGVVTEQDEPKDQDEPKEGDEPKEDEPDPAHSLSDKFYLAIPVDGTTEPISYLSVRLATAERTLDQMKMGVFGVVANTKDGGTKVVDVSFDRSGYYGLGRGACERLCLGVLYA